MFEKSPHVAPLLVRLYESQKLYDLAADDQPLAKVELTRAVTDLLEVNLNPREQELLADVLIGLMRQAEKDLRHALSERIAALDNAPLRLVLFLANDDIEVSAPVLRKSPVLSDLDLIYIIKSQGSSYWEAIAERQVLSPQVIDMLAGTRDAATAVKLTANERIQLTPYALAILTSMAKKHDEVARPLLLRPEVPRTLARELFATAGDDLRAFITSRFGFEDVSEVAQVLNEIVIEFQDASQENVPVYMPDETILMAARKIAEKGTLTTQVLINVIERGQVAMFIALFAQYTGLNVRNIHDSLAQARPRPFAIACRAFGIQKSDFSRIYLATNRMRSGDRVVNNAEMLDILEYFDKVRPEVARRVVGVKKF